MHTGITMTQKMLQAMNGVSRGVCTSRLSASLTVVFVLFRRFARRYRNPYLYHATRNEMNQKMGDRQWKDVTRPGRSPRACVHVCVQTREASRRMARTGVSWR
jgi:hypothetical protein